MSEIRLNTGLELQLDECVDLIAEVGHKLTVMLEGDMGNGKTTTLDMLAKRFPDHTPILFDMTTKDIGDMLIPKVSMINDSNVVQFAVNEELGIHLNKPVIVCLDEYGKGNQGVVRACTRFTLERKIGMYELHPDSIVYATTNKGSEGVGDLLLPHQLDRVIKVKVRKHKAVEWIDWGIANDINPAILGFVKEFPQVLQSFEDVPNPEDNPYIFHPQAQREAFVTPRSLSMASFILNHRDGLTKTTLRAGLTGAIGESAARDLVAFIDLADQLPTIDSIKESPETALVPTSNSAVCMVVYRALAVMERDWVNSWVTYMNRLNKEAQGLFANGVRAKNYHKKELLTTNKKFTDWCRENHYLYS